MENLQTEAASVETETTSVQANTSNVVSPRFSAKESRGRNAADGFMNVSIETKAGKVIRIGGLALEAKTAIGEALLNKANEELEAAIAAGVKDATEETYTFELTGSVRFVDHNPQPLEL